MAERASSGRGIAKSAREIVAVGGDSTLQSLRNKRDRDSRTFVRKEGVSAGREWGQSSQGGIRTSDGIGNEKELAEPLRLLLGSSRRDVMGAHPLVHCVAAKPRELTGCIEIDATVLAAYAMKSGGDCRSSVGRVAGSHHRGVWLDLAQPSNITIPPLQHQSFI